MKDASANADAKRLAGEAAAELVESGMVVGLGTGSTVAWTIKRLGVRVKEEGLQFLGVPTSFQAENLAIASGVMYGLCWTTIALENYIRQCGP